MSALEKVWIVAWCGYEEYSIEKLFRTHEQAEAYVAAREYRIEEYKDDDDHYWNVYCNDHYVRTCLATEDQAREALERHRADGSPHGEYGIDEYEVEPA